MIEQLILGDGELNYKIVFVLSIEGYNLMQLESVYEYLKVQFPKILLT